MPSCLGVRRLHRRGSLFRNWLRYPVADKHMNWLLYWHCIVIFLLEVQNIKKVGLGYFAFWNFLLRTWYVNILGKLFSFHFSKQLKRNKCRGSCLFGTEDKSVLHLVLCSGCQTSFHILAHCLRIWTAGPKSSQTFLWELQGKGVIAFQSSTSHFHTS